MSRTSPPDLAIGGTRPHKSVDLLRHLAGSIHEFLERVQIEGDVVRVGRVEMVHGADLHLRFRGDSDPGACLEEARRIFEMGRHIVPATRDVVAATRAAMQTHGDPEGRGAERCQRLEALAHALEVAFQRGPFLRPESYVAAHRVLSEQGRDLGPLVEVPVTTVYVY